MDMAEGATPGEISDLDLAFLHEDAKKWESGHEFTIPVYDEDADGEPEGDEFREGLTEWNGGSNMILISGSNRLPVPGGSSPREDNAMNQGSVDWRVGDDADTFARDVPLPPFRGELAVELLLATVKGQLDTDIRSQRGGGPIRRGTPTCRICGARVDQPSLNRLFASERDWDDSIANEAAAGMGGMLCKNCRVNVCELRHLKVYRVMSREDYIRSLRCLTSEVQAAINRLQFRGLGVHMYIPLSWWDALNWVLIEAQQVVHRQIEHVGSHFSSPREVQRAITRCALHNITNLEIKYFYFHALNPVDLQNVKVWCQMEVMAEQYVADFRMHIPTRAQRAKQQEDERLQATEQGTFAKDVRRCGTLTSIAGLNLWITCQLLRAASFFQSGGGL